MKMFQITRDYPEEPVATVWGKDSVEALCKYLVNAHQRSGRVYADEYVPHGQVMVWHAAS